MSYGKLNKDIYENRRRLGYDTEMFEFYDKFSDPYGSRGDVDSCDKWILRVKRDSGKGGAESNNNGRLRNIRSSGGCPAIWCGLL